MLTRKALNQRVTNFIADLNAAGYMPYRVVLFGSYAKGKPHAHSNIDLAVWDQKFTGCSTIDIEPIASIVSKYPLLELHPFSLDDTEYNNPFVKEILKQGVLSPVCLCNS
ncbi:MAG: nucleotidyltransferase domain-containing protein [Cyclobacteriaceae bacterium]|nr:nucleotidyltransferase domain-containing protein [Cyclobacteriaceae bacterium]